MGTKNKRHYIAVFKQDAVNYYHSSDKSMAKVAEELQVSQASINNWIQNAKKNDGIVIFQYIDGFYNTRRTHSTCGLESPNNNEMSNLT
ncbi:transposase [Vallitalea pronyensis]|uniref:Transposase n=1 Tax=Vallitalea pronyensis TaxID=1348613 RepID=A0A8J8MLT5_9FIRM|nr:transposase [Vallitalea pronyensis]QUI24212.1 transposase [Vallitalea pronyensis]